LAQFRSHIFGGARRQRRSDDQERNQLDRVY
jgi:hypothetical protein